jgi:stage V sporulation protein R
VRIGAASAAKRFAREIGFGLERKQEALEAYVAGHRWTEEERWEDEVVATEAGRADVYDISVEETHPYAAGGLVNHNSFWHSKIMTTRALKDSEIVDYADHHSGTVSMRPGSLNPYKIGIELYRDIEDRWNRGRFGKEWEECDDLRTRQTWDRQLGLGRQKIFEVRRHYTDVTFIDEFLTPEFCLEHKLFVYGYNDKHQAWEILSRDFKAIKEKLLHQLTNFGQPIIEVVDGNFENRGELLMAHKHDGQDLKSDYARETLRNLQTVWRRPCNLVTKVEGKGVCLRFDGQNQTEKKVDL